MTLRIRFYQELNDFLAPEYYKTEFSVTSERNASVKDLIESLGVPHTEVELIIVNGESVDFAYRVRQGDRISVYPMFESFDIGPLLRVRNKPLRVVRFVVDCHLGKLARYLRLLGFDSLYRNDYRDAEIAEIAWRQQRIVLTRDRKLLCRKIITHGYFVRAVQPRLQVREVLKRFDLYRAIHPFSRCVRCNGLLVDVAKEQITEQLEPLTRKYYDEFKQCVDCGHVYWQGGHHKRTLMLLQALITPEGTE